eukprot:sb/3464687/
MSADILFLPQELHLKLCSYLPLSDIIQLCSTCSTLYSLLDHPTDLWALLAVRDYRVPTQSSDDVITSDVTYAHVSSSRTFKDLYREFYYRCGRALGLYLVQGCRQILRIQFDSPKSLLFTAWDGTSIKGRSVLRLNKVHGERDLNAVCFENEYSDKGGERVFCDGDHDQIKRHYFWFRLCGNDALFLIDTSNPKIEFPSQRCAVDVYEGAFPETCMNYPWSKIAWKLFHPRPNISLITPGLFARYERDTPQSDNFNSLLFGLHLDDRTEGISPQITLTDVVQEEVIAKCSILMTCDLTVRGINSIVNVETPQYEVDSLPDKPLGWDLGELVHKGTKFKCPKTYKAAFFDGVRCAFVVFFNGSTIGYFGYRNGVTEIFHRISFYDRFLIAKRTGRKEIVEAPTSIFHKISHLRASQESAHMRFRHLLPALQKLYIVCIQYTVYMVT